MFLGVYVWVYIYDLEHLTDQRGETTMLELDLRLCYI